MTRHFLFVLWHLLFCCNNVQHCSRHYVLCRCLAPLPMLCAASTFSTTLNDMCCIGIRHCGQQLCYGTIAKRCSGIVQSCCSIAIGIVLQCLCWSQHHYGIFFALLHEKMDLWHWWQSFVSACGHCCEVQWQFWLVAVSAAVVTFW